MSVNKRHRNLVNDRNGTLYSHNIGNETKQSELVANFCATIPVKQDQY